MKKADTPIVLAAALVAILQATPAAAEFRTRTVDYKHGDTALEGYLAYDDSASNKRPGLLLLHRYDGMSDFTRRHAELLAKLGYVGWRANRRVVITCTRNAVLARLVPFLPRRTVLGLVHSLQSPA